MKLIQVDNKATAAQQLHHAETLDGYLEACTADPMNQLARRKKVYAPQTISRQEGMHLDAVLQQALPRLPPRLRMDLHHVFIIPLMPSAEGGMPHTRPLHEPRDGIIAVSHLDHLASTSTLIHELWHLHQRAYPDLWRTMFSTLGWTEWNGHLPAFLEANRRLNPDTIDAPLWIYDNTWVPVPVFRDISLPNLTEVDIWFYHVTEEYHLKQVPRTMAAFFSGLPPSAYEHPRELTAYLLAEPRDDSPALRSMRTSMGQLSFPPS